METSHNTQSVSKGSSNILVKLFAIIGGFAIVVFFVCFVAFFTLMGEEPVPGKTILEINLETGFIEYVPDDPLARMFFDGNTIVREVVEALEKAANDDRVLGLIARIGEAPIGLARVQEIRDAVSAFRESGKPAVAFSETFGEFGPGNVSYYLSTAFEEIYLQPTGGVGLTGLISESPFVRGVLEKLGITPHGDHRHEYKNALNMFTEREYTEYHKEATQRMMESQFGQIVKGIAEARNLSEDEVRSIIDRGPLLAQEALDANLVDGLKYRDEVFDDIMNRTDDDAEFLYVSKYYKRAGSPFKRGETIALIYGTGSVVRGKSGFDPIFQDVSMGCETVTHAFRSAIKDKNVKAILFRVDSPGGSHVASDAIWREVVRAREAGIPVIVSMSDVAGSGGYYVSMAANKIVAQPATITASIGVLGTKMLTSEFWEKTGISWDEVHTSNNAIMWTGTKDYTPEGWARFQAWLDMVYEDFTGKVSQGRDIPIEEVLRIAKGRIWSGEDAKELGLVDELGGFHTALRLAREEAGIPADAPVKLKLFPKKKTTFDFFFGEEPESSEDSIAQSILVKVLNTIQPVTHLIKSMGLSPSKGVLTMPPINNGEK